MGMVTMKYHKFLLSDRKVDPVEQVIRLRDFTENRPKTASTFHLKKAVESGNANGDVARGAMKMVGVWEVPERYTGDVRGIRVVNPYSVNAHRYSDVAVVCECGEVLTVPQVKSHAENPLDSGNTHTDDCPAYHRLEADARLARKREEVIRESLLHGVGGDRLCRRLSLKSTSYTSTARTLDLDLDGLREEYRQARANTMLELRRQGRSPDEIARVYDITKCHVRKEVAKRTDTSFGEVMEDEPWKRKDEPEDPPSSDLPVWMEASTDD